MDPSEPTSDFSPILKYLQDLHDTHSALHEGAPAAYIPELAKKNPDLFGICVATTDGHVYEVGDSREPFSIQSISKPFVYGLALEDHGRAHVFTKVGVEPTGDAFNSISLDPATGRPRNPMINAGAIATTGMIEGKSVATRWRRILEMFSRFAGRELSLDMDVYHSESETGHRNRAIGHMLRNFEILTEEPRPVVDLYFKQCSISVTARDLAIMAATLANGGVNPLTGTRALRGEYLESVLSVMGTCGMYDFAGEWLFKVGLPAKSGVAGGIIAVLPGQIGIGVFSPRVDAQGNSIRGIRVCDDLSRSFNLHLFNSPAAVQSVIRLKFTAAEVGSNRVRTAAESAVLGRFGKSIQVYQLQGNLTFARTERVVRDAFADFGEIGALILDFKRVASVNEPAARLLYQMLARYAEAEKPVILTHAGPLTVLRRMIKVKLGTGLESLVRIGKNNDLALEWCENRLLEKHLPTPPGEVSPCDSAPGYELLAGLGPDELATVSAAFERRRYPAGLKLISAGDSGRELFFLAKGTVSVMLDLASGDKERLATFSPGMAFGELAVIDGGPRSSDVVADTETECDVLSLEAFERIGAEHPGIKFTLLQNISVLLSHRLRRANRELSVYD